MLCFNLDKFWRCVFVIWIGTCGYVTASPTAPAARAVEPYFRNDYTYVKQQQVFIKVNAKPKTWSASRTQCEAEGANLAVISTEAEAKIVADLLKSVAPKQSGAWIGIHDIFIEDEFMTVFGESALNYYLVWSQNQPDNAQGDEDCVSIMRDGKLNDAKCSIKLPFICRKEADSVIVNVKCETYDRNYKMGILGDQSCFKLHLKPKNWNDALQTCQYEQAHLAVINSEDEAKLYADELAKYPKDKIPGNFNKDIVLLGFHDRFEPGDYLTIDGTPLSESGYEKWANGQPDNAQGNEHCGSMFRPGLLNDVPCDTKFMFICEKSIGDPFDVAIFSRFQEDQ